MRSPINNSRRKDPHPKSLSPGKDYENQKHFTSKQNRNFIIKKTKPAINQPNQFNAANVLGNSTQANGFWRLTSAGPVKMNKVPSDTLLRQSTEVPPDAMPVRDMHEEEQDYESMPSEGSLPAFPIQSALNNYNPLQNQKKQPLPIYNRGFQTFYGGNSFGPAALKSQYSSQQSQFGKSGSSKNQDLPIKVVNNPIMRNTMYNPSYPAQKRQIFTSEVTSRPVESHQRKRRNIGIIEGNEVFEADLFPQARAKAGQEDYLPINVQNEQKVVGHLVNDHQPNMSLMFYDFNNFSSRVQSAAGVQRQSANQQNDRVPSRGAKSRGGRRVVPASGAQQEPVQIQQVFPPNAAAQLRLGSPFPHLSKKQGAAAAGQIYGQGRLMMDPIREEEAF